MISPLEDGDLPPFGAIAAGATAAREHAAARASVYAALSFLSASPSDAAHSAEALAEAVDQASLAAGALPYDHDFAELLRVAATLREPDAAMRWARDYSALFEVGERGPPLPIREELAAGAAAASKEEVVRFYEHFGYALEPAAAWQPDHLSVLLEFLHFLAFHESGADPGEAVDSLRRAQRDFLARHVLDWLPGLAGLLRHTNGETFAATLFDAITAFARADHAWLARPFDA
jgi:DMSO reductase family type II enzyme chaperone